MTQYSIPWGGTSTGDAGPFDATDWSEIWQALFTVDPTVQGILAWIGGKLTVSVTSGSVNTATGAALVNGNYYRNTAVVNTVIPASVSADRTDYVVLRKDHVGQTVRIARLAGTEGGAAPSLTQNNTTYWDILLASVTTNPANDLTVVNENKYLHIGVPVDGVLYNQTSIVPAGFSEFTLARGRFVAGLPSGGTPSGTVGDALTDKEELTHVHDYTQVPYHRHNIRANQVDGVDFYGLEICTTAGETIGYTNYTGVATCTTEATSHMMPYIQLLGMVNSW